MEKSIKNARRQHLAGTVKETRDSKIMIDYIKTKQKKIGKNLFLKGCVKYYEKTHDVKIILKYYNNIL